MSNDPSDDAERNDELRRIRMHRRRIAALAGLIVIHSEFPSIVNQPVPCYTSELSGFQWVQEVLGGNEHRSINSFRMEAHVFQNLGNVLESKYGLRNSRAIGVHEKLGMFVHTLSHGLGNRMICERFQHSGETVHRCFYAVMDSVMQLASDIIKPRDLYFTQVPEKIRNDTRYWPYFKNCIGAIDGTHIPVVPPSGNYQPWIGRKGKPTQNVLAVCDFNMLFTFVCAGWEGSAHDNKILTDVLSKDHYNFPRAPPGKYYVVDSGYPNRTGFLAPYKGHRYHIPDFRRGGRRPQGSKEIFNHAHSSLRGVIERSFGVLKKKWLMLSRMPSFPIETQGKIVVACMALNNFIRLNALDDEDFNDTSNDVTSNDVTQGEGSNNPSSSVSQDDNEMGRVRDEIALMLRR